MNTPPRDLSEAFHSHHHRIECYQGGWLFAELHAALPDRAAQYSWETRAAFGGIYVNGLAAVEDQQLPVPALIEYYEPKFPLAEAHTFYPAFDPNWIVFEDAYLIACAKPARLPTMPAKEQHQFSLRKYLDTYVGHPVHCPSRLDMSTQGLVIVSKRPESHGPLQKLFEQKKIQKSYLFLSHHAPSWNEMHVDAPIGKSAAHPVLRAIEGSDAKAAATDFSLVQQHTFVDSAGTEHHGAFIRAQPRTGRTHQIRVHASAQGCPIVGDKFYGSVPFDCLGLLSYRLDFIHPIFDKPTTIELHQAVIPHWAKAAKL
jgi:23S rRNA pseudouridine1911/1915/1917 synthase